MISMHTCTQLYTYEVDGRPRPRRLCTVSLCLGPAHRMHLQLEAIVIQRCRGGQGSPQRPVTSTGNWHSGCRPRPTVDLRSRPSKAACCSVRCTINAWVWCTSSATVVLANSTAAVTVDTMNSAMVHGLSGTSRCSLGCDPMLNPCRMFMMPGHICRRDALERAAVVAMTIKMGENRGKARRPTIRWPR